MSIDYNSFLSKHDLIWKKAPRSIFEGPFMGNGETGTDLYFDSADNLYINIGNTDIYDNRKDESGKISSLFQNMRLPLGGFLMKTDGGFSGCEMRLSLYDAETKGTLKTNSGYIEFSTFVLEEKSAFVFEWAEFGAELSVVFSPAKAISPRQLKMIELCDDRALKNYEPPKEPYLLKKDGAASHVQPKFSGGEYSVAYKIFEQGSKKTFVCLIGNSESGRDNATNFSALDSIYNNLSAEKEKHALFWHKFYEKSFLSLNDTMIEGFYYIQLYKCASSTRVGKRVFDTAGPWLPKMTAWPATWWNLNVQLNYSPLYASNHLEIAGSLSAEIIKHLPDLKNNVPEEYRNGEYCVVGRTTCSDYSSDSGIPGISKIENDLELGNLLWALYCCFVEFSSACNKKGFSEKLFPVLKGCAEYIINFLYEGEDKALHLLPTASPEYPGLGTDCNYNLSLLRWALITLIKLDEEYKLGCENASLWQNTLDKLVDFPYDENDGFKIASDISLDESHRHYSHLLMFYPLHIINEENPQEREKIIKSINHWQSMPEGLQGYSQSGAASMFAVLGDGNRAYKHLMNLFDGFINPNTMYDEGENPVLETPPAAAKSVLDMVFLSFGDEIRVFTGTPDEWQNVSFSGLLSENGCLVSAKRMNGKTTFISVEAKAAVTVKIKAHFGGDIKSDGSFEFKDGVYYISLLKGEKRSFFIDGENGSISPVDDDKKYFNYFGLK